MAASRSIHIPHTAAIKLRRASSSNISKVLDTEEFDLVRDSTSSETSQADGKLIQDELRWDNFKAADVEVRGEIVARDETRESSSLADESCSCEEMVVEGADELKVDDLGDVATSRNSEPEGTPPTNADEGRNLDDHSGISVTIDVSDGDGNENADASSAHTVSSEFIEDKIVYSPGSVRGGHVEDLAPAVEETRGSENVKLQEKREEFGLAGDDNTAQTDVTTDGEDAILEWERKKGGERTGVKSRLSMKPIELAEELEKKDAFAGLNWEEGAAAQPMRLEGVRRGSTVLGYFDVSTDNAITRTLSSQAFRRDHGSPQVVAVHLNFVAVGMSRGVIVVFPSKYSPHHADNMDAKVACLLEFCDIHNLLFLSLRNSFM